jgi:hypothetical protein
VREHTVDIEDSAGTSFKIHVSTPSNWKIGGLGATYNFGETVDADMTGADEVRKRVGLGPDAAHLHAKHYIGGSWRAIDKGLIRYHSGNAVGRKSNNGDLTTSDLFLLNMDGTYGMELFEYESISGANANGHGMIVQPWVVGFAPGKFIWTLID